MRDNYKKRISYLYYGLITSALAGFMLVWGILSAVRGEGLWVIVTSFIAAAVWCVTAAMSLYVYYDANRSTISSDNIDSE